MKTALDKAALDRWLTTPPDELDFEIDAARGTGADVYAVNADLYDVPSLIEKNDDAQDLIAALTAERDSLLLRLAEYRSVNQLATDALEKYFARFGALS